MRNLLKSWALLAPSQETNNRCGYFEFLKAFLILVFCAVTTFSHAREDPLITDKVSNVLTRLSPEISTELKKEWTYARLTNIYQDI